MSNELSDADVEHLVSHIKDYQLTHGSLLKLVAFEEPTTVSARPVMVSALPTSFPRQLFNEAVDLQRSMCELYMRAAADEPWLYGVMKPLIEHDELLSALWNVHRQVMKASLVQDVICGIFRSDYMVHEGRGSLALKQVEVNTISVAGACHAERVANMHRHLYRVRSADLARGIQPFPLNQNTKSIVKCLKAAHEMYRCSSVRQTCILMPVEPFNFNIADERPIEYGLWDADVPCYRCNWLDITERTTLTEDRTLRFRPALDTNIELEVSVVYYRAGYAAKDYDQAGQTVRLTLELSRAIKCPDVLTHLTTFKVVQQALTQPDVVERFLPLESVATVRQTFVPMLPLDASPAGLSARKIAMDPKQAVNYVLKPNLEGGGNNVYRSDIPSFLATVPPEHWHKFILMRLIDTPSHTQGSLMLPGELYRGPVVSELGILGACIWRKKGTREGRLEVLKNDVAGWTFKTKPRDVDEMSVVKGHGCFDCPLLEG